MKLPEELKTNLEEISNKYKQTELKNAFDRRANSRAEEEARRPVRNQCR